MLEKTKYILSNVSGFSNKFPLELFIFIVIIFSIIFTVFLVQQNQNINSKAYVKNGETINNQIKKPEYVQGEVLIKLKKDAPILKVKKEKVTEGIDLDKNSVIIDDLDTSESASKEIVDFLKRNNFTKIEKVFKGVRSPVEEIAKFKAKFPKREKLISPNAQKIDLSKNFKLSFDKSTPLINQLQVLANSKYIEYAEPNKIYRLSTADDPYYLDHYSDNVGFRDPNWNPPYDYQWGLKKIKADLIWDQISSSSASIPVAVSDSGVDRNHEDIQANMWVNNNETPNNGVDDDGNGYIDDYYGWNFITDTNDPIDDNGHGSHVAGIVNASSSNSKGIAGTNLHSKIMAVKGLDNYGSGSIDGLASGIIYSQQNGARVINASWGASGFSQTAKDAVDSAVAFGVVFVAAAGNSSADSRFHTPAGLRNAITVGSSDINDRKSDFSNNVGIDFLAPGGNSTTDSNGANILSLRATGTDLYGDGNHIVNNNYMRARGTSMAAPFVSGVIAALLTKNDAISVEEIRSMLRVSADKVDSGKMWTKDVGYGRINLEKAFSLLNSSKYNVVRILTPDTFVIDSNSISISFVAYGYSISKWVLEFGEGIEPASWTQISEGNTASVPNSPTSLSFNTSNLINNNNYTFRVRLLSNDPSITEIEDRLIMMKSPPVKWKVSPLNGAGFHTSSPVIDDIDGDGKKEAVLTDNKGTLYIIASDGSLKKSVSYTPWYADLQETAAIGDLDPNAPGKEIVIPVHGGSNNYYLRMIYANGTINSKAPWPVFLGGQSTHGREIAPLIVDVNDDGKLEILQIAQDKVFLLNSDGTPFSVAWPKNYQRIALVMVGKFSKTTSKDLQIMAVNNSGQIAIFDHSGNQINTFSLQTTTTNHTPGIVLQDIDGDGVQEIIAKYYKYLDISPNFNDIQAIGVYKSDGNLLWEKILGRAGFDIEWPLPILTDLNNDGVREIVVSDEDSVWFFTKDGKEVGGWPKFQGYDILNFSSGDKNGDNSQEIYYSQPYAPATVGIIDKGVSIGYFIFSNNWSLTHPVIEDIDGDNHLELIIHSAFGGPLIAYDLGAKANNNPFNLQWPLYLYNNQRTSAIYPSAAPSYCTTCNADLNMDGNVNIVDFSTLSDCFNKPNSNCKNSRADINRNGTVDQSDFDCLKSKYGQKCSFICTACKADVNQDTFVNIKDFSTISGCFDQSVTSCSNTRADVNGDGIVEKTDGDCVQLRYSQKCTSEASSTPAP